MPSPAAAGQAMDNAVDMFHAITRIDIGSLADPGVASFDGTVKFKKSFAETMAAGAPLDHIWFADQGCREPTHTHDPLEGK